ncbi:hypothetical protein [Nonomuraea candida]|uniref:hypothetical protein n=1 Tax=Nonomuraea candida TaxID=359159 RepID=UPI0005BDBC4E|nr:hypothetical protein [Nonomuraea candida]
MATWIQTVVPIALQRRVGKQNELSQIHYREVIHDEKHRRGTRRPGTAGRAGLPVRPARRAYERLRERAPSNRMRLVGGAEAWWVSGHEAGRAILAGRLPGLAARGVG